MPYRPGNWLLASWGGLQQLLRYILQQDVPLEV